MRWLYIYFIGLSDSMKLKFLFSRSDSSYCIWNSSYIIIHNSHTEIGFFALFVRRKQEAHRKKTIRTNNNKIIWLHLGFDIYNIMNAPRYRRCFLSLILERLLLRTGCGFWVWVSNYFQFNLTILFRTIYIVSDLIVVPFFLSYIMCMLLHTRVFILLMPLNSLLIYTSRIIVNEPEPERECNTTHTAT